MKINWRLRLQNKTTLISLIVGIIAVIYQILSAFKLIPLLQQELVVNIALCIVDLLCLLGIVVDPTTEGIGDSDRANGYTEPYKSLQTININKGDKEE